MLFYRALANGNENPAAENWLEIMQPPTHQRHNNLYYKMTNTPR
jgi:hypothetical protein